MSFLGLFSSDSKTQQTQNTTNVVDTTNVNVQGGSAPTLLDSSGNTFITSDQGAFDAATDVSREASQLGSEAIGAGQQIGALGLDAANRSFANSLNFASDVTDNALNKVSSSGADALDFGRYALDANERTTSGAVAAVSDATSGVLSFARSLFGDVVDANRDTILSSMQSTSDLARQVSSTDGDRVAKVAGYALLAIAAIFILKGAAK